MFEMSPLGYHGRIARIDVVERNQVVQVGEDIFLHFATEETHEVGN